MAGRKKAVDFGNNPYENPKEDSHIDIGILNETSKNVSNGNRVQMLTVNKLIPNEKNNNIYDITDLEALAKDISERGIQQPLIVRLRPDGKYTIVSGHRRLAAYNLAVTKFGYNNGECLPCLLQNDIHSDLEEREALILNNLQRDKSDFNRMMEIVEMRKCAEERRDLGEKIENIRIYIMNKLGVSNSEISRFEKIYSSLISPLMESFRNQLIATNVAFQIAKLEENAQQYIHEHWDRKKDDGMLTFPAMKALLKEFNESEEIDSHDVPEPQEIIEESWAKEIKYENIETGISQIAEQFSDLTTIKGSFENLSQGAKNKLLRRLNKIQKELSSMQQELTKHGINKEVADGKN